MNNERVIYLDSDVGKGILGYFINQIETFEAVSHDDITVVANSFGGCCWTILSIIDAMHRSPCTFKIIAIGKVMSAGAFLLACGAPKGNRYLFPNTSVMFHEPRGQANVSGYNGLVPMELIRERFVDLMMQASDKSRDEILAEIDRDNYLSAQEAIDAGYADYIIGADRYLNV